MSPTYRHTEESVAPTNPRADGMALLIVSYRTKTTYDLEWPSDTERWTCQVLAGKYEDHTKVPFIELAADAHVRLAEAYGPKVDVEVTGVNLIRGGYEMGHFMQPMTLIRDHPKYRMRRDS